jgi:superfamily II DNA or RNA helicase
MTFTPPPASASALSSNVAFEEDIYGDLQPVEVPVSSNIVYEEDIYGDLQPVEVPIPATRNTATRVDYVPTEETREYLHHLLRQHFPSIPEPTFKSTEQMLAVELALSRQENFVLVLPTGAGKSLAFTLPPFNEPMFRTYVVVPNKALLNDHVERCKKLGLQTFQWLSHHKGVPDEAQIVFLALESATTQTFRM